MVMAGALMAAAMVFAVGLVGFVAYVLSHVAHEERVSDAWRDHHERAEGRHD